MHKDSSGLSDRSHYGGTGGCRGESPYLVVLFLDLDKMYYYFK